MHIITHPTNDTERAYNHRTISATLKKRIKTKQSQITDLSKRIRNENNYFLEKTITGFKKRRYIIQKQIEKLIEENAEYFL